MRTSVFSQRTPASHDRTPLSPSTRANRSRRFSRIVLRPPVTVPIHFDDYNRFASPLGDFVAEVGRRELPGQLRTVHRGDTISLRA